MFVRPSKLFNSEDFSSRISFDSGLTTAAAATPLPGAQAEETEASSLAMGLGPSWTESGTVGCNPSETFAVSNPLPLLPLCYTMLHCTFGIS